MYWSPPRARSEDHPLRSPSVGRSRLIASIRRGPEDWAIADLKGPTYQVLFKLLPPAVPLSHYAPYHGFADVNDATNYACIAD